MIFTRRRSSLYGGAPSFFVHNGQKTGMNVSTSFTNCLQEPQSISTIILYSEDE